MCYCPIIKSKPTDGRHSQLPRNQTLPWKEVRYIHCRVKRYIESTIQSGEQDLDNGGVKDGGNVLGPLS